MLEELVGSTWHRFITQRALANYPEEGVSLEDMQLHLGIFFRALGGEGGLQVKKASASKVLARRGILQRIAGSGDTIQYAWRDEEALRLPDTIALFPSKVLNKDLYYWLSALSVINSDPEHNKNWISRNQYRTKQLLTLWPGLAPRYQRLLQAHLKQRPSSQQMTEREAQQEQAICKALADSAQPVELVYAKRPPQPVPLWLHPAPPKQEFLNKAVVQDPDREDANTDKKKKQQAKSSKQGKREDMPEGKSGLMSFRLESLWSWAEYSKVDRTTTEDDDDDAMRTAEDMDQISVAQDQQTTASKLKLDLDLPSNEYDDVLLEEGVPVDEWDYKTQHLLKDHCRLQVMLPRDSEPSPLPEHLRSKAHKIRRQFESLQPQRQWVGRQQEGTELDLENYIGFLADKQQGRVNSDTPVYRELKDRYRDMSCLLLADLSLSTDAYVSNHAKVIDVIRDAILLFAEALDNTGDQFALHGFSSRNRGHIRYYNIKTFKECYGDVVRGHVLAMRPNYYTRMGAAIRHATAQLVKQKTRKKLLLILTDGKPNDLDKYEGRYGLEDTRMAVIEAQQAGLTPFCITIDENAEDYLPYLFGSRNYVLVRNAEELPKKLPLLYFRLTQ